MDSKLIFNLEDFIYLGYQWIEKIEEDYRNSPRTETQAILGKYYRLVKKWEEHVKQGLQNAYRRAEFVAAKTTDPTYESGKSIDVQNLIKSIRARIDVLKDFKRELQSPSVSLGAQARLNINSTDSSVNIISDKIAVVNKLELEFEQNYKGADRKALISLIQELKQNPEPKRRNEILGKLLSRGAEVAQIVSLITQLLNSNPN